MDDIIGYSVSAVDGDSYYFENAPASVFCPGCGSCVDDSYVPRSLRVRRPVYDACGTYDGRLIVSQKVKDFHDRHGCGPAEFRLVNRKRRWYMFRPTRVLEYDAERRGTRFMKYCAVCGRHEEVAGATPAFLRNLRGPIGEGFYRTDVEFGSGREKHPLVIMGLATYPLLLKEKLKGLEFELKPIRM